MKTNRDQLTGIASVLIGIWVLISIRGYSIPFTMEYPGPKALPGLAAIGFIVCGMGIFVGGCKKKTKDEVFLTKAGWIKLLLNFLLVTAYILTMKFFGFLIATPIFLFVTCTWYAKGYSTKVWQRILFAAIVTAVIYLAYQMAFGYTLPTGELFG